MESAGTVEGRKEGRKEGGEKGTVGRMGRCDYGIRGPGKGQGSRGYSVKPGRDSPVA